MAAGEDRPPLCGRGLTDVALDEALAGNTPARLLGLWLRAGPVGKRNLERYARGIAPRVAAVRGHDFRDRGVPDGPAVGVALRAARRAALRGVRDREAQLLAGLAGVQDWRRPQGPPGGGGG
jgi:hypothetical protein